MFVKKKKKFFVPFASETVCGQTYLVLCEKFISEKRDESCRNAYIKLLLEVAETKKMSFVIGKYCGITLALLYALSIVFHTTLG